MNRNSPFVENLSILIEVLANLVNLDKTLIKQGKNYTSVKPCYFILRKRRARDPKSGQNYFKLIFFFVSNWVVEKLESQAKSFLGIYRPEIHGYINYHTEIGV